MERSQAKLSRKVHQAFSVRFLEVSYTSINLDTTWIWFVCRALPLDWLGHIWVPEVQISNAEAIRVNGDLPNKKLVVEEEDKALVYEMK